MDLWIPGGNGYPPRHVAGRRTPLDDAVTLTLDGFEASSRAVIPKDGTWVAELEHWEGWVGGWSVTTDTMPSPTGDGIVSGSNTYGARTLTLSGMILADYRTATPRIVHDAGDRISAVLSGTVRKAPILVTEHMLGLTRECDVRLAQAPDFTMHSPNAATWTMYLVADDPVRYETSDRIVQVGQTLSIRNRGTVRSRPLVNFYGPVVNPWFEVGGTRFTLKVTIPAGNALTADTRRRMILDSNGARYAIAASGAWPALDPGETTVTFGADSGSGYGQLRRMSAWM